MEDNYQIFRDIDDNKIVALKKIENNKVYQWNGVKEEWRPTGETPFQITDTIDYMDISEEDAMKAIEEIAENIRRMNAEV